MATTTTTTTTTTKTITTSAELYRYLDGKPHDERPEGMQLYDVQYTGAALYDAGWRADDPDTLAMLAEQCDDGYWLTSVQARRILDDMAACDSDEEGDE